MECKKCGGELPKDRPDLADQLVTELDEAGFQVGVGLAVVEVCSECREQEVEK